jgi:hypothetical protein
MVSAYNSAASTKTKSLGGNNDNWFIRLWNK